MYFGSECDNPALLSEKEMDALLAAAEDFAQKVSVLDRQSKDIGDHEEETRVTRLKKQKETLVTDTAASLLVRLGVGAEKVRRHLNDNFKRKVKIRPGIRKLVPAKRSLLSNHADPFPPPLTNVYTYSDSWLVNNSGTEYDASNDEWQMGDTANGTNEIAAVGVTEADYDSGSESVQTTHSRVQMAPPQPIHMMICGTRVLS